MSKHRRKKRNRFIGKAAPDFQIGPGDGSVSQAQYERQMRDFGTIGNEAVTLGPSVPPIAQPLDQSGQPRTFQYRTGWNIPSLPGEGRPVDLQTLRQLANTYDMLRKAIEIRKDELCACRFDIIAREPDRRRAKDVIKAQQGKIQEIKAFFARPDRKNTWQSWMRMLLEEYFVPDAVSVYKWRTLGGKLYGLRLLDGSTIKPLLTIQGDTPAPPDWAYQQYLFGRPVWSFTTDEFIYAPKNKRINTPYGFCYDDETEILTSKGWKRFADVSGDEEVATRSADGRFEWQRPTAYINQYYNGPMCHLHSKSVDLMVTPEHRVLLDSLPRGCNGGKKRSIKGGEVVVRAGDLLTGHTPMNKIPMVSEWTGVEIGSVMLHAPLAEAKQVARRRADGTVATYTRSGFRTEGKSFELSGDDYCALVGAYLAEGNIRAQGGIEINQRQQSKGHGAFAQLCERIMPGAKHHNGKAFILGRVALSAHFCQFGHASEKFVPENIMNASKRQLRIFWDHYVLGDGHFEKRVNKSGRGRPLSEKAVRLTTTSQRLADQLVEIAQKLGWSASMRCCHTAGPSVVAGRPCKIHDSYVVSVRYAKAMGFKVKQLVYSGLIYCVSVPNGIVYVRRNGKPAWCGNSPVEQFLWHVTQCLKFNRFNLDYFTDGTIPEGVAEAPSTWTKEQIAEFNLYWDELLSGDTRALKKLQFVPAGFVWHQFKPFEFNLEFARWLVGLTAAAMDLTPQELGFEPQHVGLGGKGYAEEQSRVLKRKSTGPIIRWLCDEILNPIIWDEFGATDLQAVLHTALEDDEQLTRMQARDLAIRNATVSIDQAVEEEGEEPPGIGRIFVFGNQILFEPDLILGTKEGAAAVAAAKATPKVGPGQTENAGTREIERQENESRNSASEETGTDQVAENADEEPADSEANKSAIVRDEVQRFLRFADKRREAGKWRDYTSDVISEATLAALNKAAKAGASREELAGIAGLEEQPEHFRRSVKEAEKAYLGIGKQLATMVAARIERQSV